ncbi:MAG: hypothetical protein OZ913_07550 [Ignavibacteriaceae bacterium]|nr:glycosyltransferase family 39 protein [Ignavibacteria bacterium]MEB2330142.1 hypothetical protein [Ignavibacteriaceae bacterium]
MLKELSHNGKRQLTLILSGALIVRILFAFILSVELRSDSMVYDELAKSIAFNGKYSFEGKTTALLIAGYPLFLSAIYKFAGTEQIFVKLIQALIDTATCFIFFLVLRKFFTEKYSLTGLLIFAFFPSNVLYSQTILTEPLFGFFAMALFFILLLENAYRFSFLTGLIWGIAIFIRSSFAPSVILYPVFLFIKRKKLFGGFKTNRWRKAVQFSALFLVGVLLILSPWLIRNKIEFNSFTLATQGGFTFWSGSNPNATGTWYHKIEESDPLFSEEDEVKRDREFYRRGFEYAIANPHRFVLTGFKKLAYLFSSERMILLYFTNDQGKSKTSTEVYKSLNPIYIAIVNLPYFAIMIGGLWGLLIFNRRNFFLIAFICSWMITIFFFVALSRYHYVLIPFFTIGFINLLMNFKTATKNLNPLKYTIGIAGSLFLFGTWSSEFYLMYT